LYNAQVSIQSRSTAKESYADVQMTGLLTSMRKQFMTTIKKEQRVLEQLQDITDTITCDNNKRISNGTPTSNASMSSDFNNNTTTTSSSNAAPKFTYSPSLVSDAVFRYKPGIGEPIR